MRKFKANLNNVENVKRFCNEASKVNGDIDVMSGRYAIDGKSIMGLFSLDLSKELDIVIRADKEDEFVAKMIEMGIAL